MSVLEHYNAAIEGILNGRLKDSERHVREGLELFPDSDHLAFLAGWHLTRSDLAAGMRLMDRGRGLGLRGSPPLTRLGIRRWVPGEALAGKRAAVLIEAGYGDQIAYVRFARDLAQQGADVRLVCSPCLGPIFSRCLGMQARGRADVEADVWAASQRLPWQLGCRWEDLDGAPYLFPREDLREAWARRLAPGFRVGVRWFGNKAYGYEHLRRYDPACVIAAVRAAGGTPYALHDTPTCAGAKDVSSLIAGSWEETAALIYHMHLVVTSETSVAHVSAAMGVPTWQLTTMTPHEYFMLPGDRTPWYSAMRLFRQTVKGDWGPALEAVCSQLKCVARAWYDGGGGRQ